MQQLRPPNTCHSREACPRESGERESRRNISIGDVAMPTYDYLCDNCGHKFEKFQSITARPLRKCPKCHRAAAKTPHRHRCRHYLQRLRFLRNRLQKRKLQRSQEEGRKAPHRHQGQKRHQNRSQNRTCKRHQKQFPQQNVRYALHAIPSVT